MISAERLRAAADLLERTGAAATPGPWQWYGDSMRPWDDENEPRPVDFWRVSRDDERAHADTETEADAAWIALVGPDTAPALAAWLRDQLPFAEERFLEVAGGPGLAVQRALAFADLILRGQT